MKYYFIEVDNAYAITGRTIRTENASYLDIQKHVENDKPFKKGCTPHLIGCKEVDQAEYDSFINCFVESEREKVISGTTI